MIGLGGGNRGERRGNGKGKELSKNLENWGSERVFFGGFGVFWGVFGQ